MNKTIKNIRTNILNLTYKAQSSHIGSCLSIVEILVTLYSKILKKDDRFILSKGHAALALYSTLYEKKLISLKTLNTFGSNKTILMNHVSHKVNGVEFSTGSLGHGLPIAVGKALKFKINKENNKVFVLLSDGEMNEGTTWESLLFASHHKLDNLRVIIDYNKIQSMDFVKKVINIEPLKSKLLAFGCNVDEVNGHNIKSLTNTLNKKNKNKPRIIIAHTIKGKGISFMENDNLWHYKNPTLDQLKLGLDEIKKNMRKLFIKELIKLNNNKKIYLIINDLGFSVIEPFKDKFPNRIFNAGVSEQNMMGMAAGIASEKCNVFVYSIANFSTFRCAEQIRNDIDYHNLPVTIVSVGSGVGYGNLGYTHHALQDYSLMRSFPNMLILSPGNNNELTSILKYIKKNPQPSYLRLDKNEHKAIKPKKIILKPGKFIKLINGNPEKMILTTGSVQDIARNIILKKYKNYSLYSMPLWGMKAKNFAKQTIKKFKEIITIEDHFYDGGFGSWIKECINDTDIKTTIKSKYINSNVINEVGSNEYLLKKFGPR